MSKSEKSYSFITIIIEIIKVHSNVC